ncbi:MAG: hypothetical protein ACI4GB_08380 [Acutalibacteraceae bacterium]
MNNETPKAGFQLLHKPKKGKMGALLIVFLWIALWNIVYQAIHGIWHDWSIQIINWSFFAAVTLFFMQEELTYKERFWHTLVGGSVGLLLAAGVIVVCQFLVKSGLPKLPAILIPLLISIAVLILAAPYLPMIFNNVGFIYLIVSFVETDKLVANLPSNLLSLLLGSLILNLGCSFLIGLYTKNMAKKAAAKAEAKTKA